MRRHLIPLILLLCCALPLPALAGHGEINANEAVAQVKAIAGNHEGIIYEAVDLNRDGIHEVLVMLDDSCGTRGCSYSLMAFQNDEWVEIGNFFGGLDSYEAVEDGWDKIVFIGRGWGNDTVQTTHAFNGTNYVEIRCKVISCESKECTERPCQ